MLFSLGVVPMLERFIASHAKEIALQISLRTSTRPLCRLSRFAMEQSLVRKEIRQCPDSSKQSRLWTGSL